MLVQAQLASGKITNTYILQDGRYLLNIIPIKDKTKKEFQENYFAVLDEICNDTGNKRYDLHNTFKKEVNIESIKNITIEEWPQILYKLKMWCIFIND